MSDGSHVDRRFDQTQHEYAANDLEIIEEAHRYGQHVFELFRPFTHAEMPWRLDERPGKGAAEHGSERTLLSVSDRAERATKAWTVRQSPRDSPFAG